MNGLRGWIMAGWCVLAAASAWAVYEPAQLPNSSRRWAVNVGLRGEYDDNIFTADTDPESSFKSIIDPQLLVNLPGDQTFAGLRYTYRMTYFENRSSDPIDQEHIVDVLFSHTFNPRLTLDVNNQFRHGVEPELVESSAGVPVILRRQGDFLYNSLNGTLSYNLSRRWVAAVRGGWQVWDYDVSTVASNNNRNVYDSTLSLRYAVDPRTTAGVNYRYSRTDYDIAEINDVRNSDSHLGFVSVIRRFNPKWSAELDTGAEYRAFDNGDTQVAPLVDASTTYNYAPQSAVTAGLRYSIEVTEVSTYRSADALSFFGQINHQLTPKLSAGGKVVLVVSQLENPVLAGAADNIEEVEFQLGLNLRYQFTRWCSGELGYTFDMVNSDLAGQDFDRNRASAGVRFVY